MGAAKGMGGGVGNVYRMDGHVGKEFACMLHRKWGQGGSKRVKDKGLIPIAVHVIC